MEDENGEVKISTLGVLLNKIISPYLLRRRIRNHLGKT